MLLLALALAVPAPADWREFDRRQRGWDETPAEYDAARLRRRGARVLVWIRYEVRLSGLPDLRNVERLELDCARRRGRRVEIFEYGGIHALTGRPGHRRPRARFAPIAAGSVEEALARVVCAGGTVAP